MNEFKASNGVTVTENPIGRLTLSGEEIQLDRLREKLGGGDHSGISPAAATALREFFLHERDEELGRWRWPENPDYVVYDPTEDDEPEDDVLVLFEPGGGSNRYTREWLAEVVQPESWAIARCLAAYFDAHPEPKPWHDAKPGEVWLLTLNGAAGPWSYSSYGEHPWIATDDPANRIAADHHGITAGRRIWPESD